MNKNHTKALYNFIDYLPIHKKRRPRKNKINDADNIRIDPHLWVQWLSLGKTKQTTAVSNSMLTFSLSLLNLESEMHNDWSPYVFIQTRLLCILVPWDGSGEIIQHASISDIFLLPPPDNEYIYMLCASCFDFRQQAIQQVAHQFQRPFSNGNKFR